MELLSKVLHSPHFPDRAALSGGVASIAAFLLSSYLHLDAQTSAALVGAAFALVNHFVPESVIDIARKADTVIKDDAGKVTDILWKFDGKK